MGLDVGDKTIGLAVSDPLAITAQGLYTLKRSSVKNEADEINRLIKTYNIDMLVIGLPKNMNNTIGPRALMVKRYADKLKELLNIPYVLFDERLTTAEAQKILIDSDISRKNRKKVIDKMAAVLILQGYLDSLTIA